MTSLSDLLKHPTYTLSENVGGDTVQALVGWLRDQLTASEPEVTIILNTIGGVVHDGIALHDAIELLRDAVKINVVAMGACQSAGVTILLGAEPKRRFSAPHTRFMVHLTGQPLDEGGIVRAWEEAPSEELLGAMDKVAGVSVTQLYGLRDTILELVVANTKLSPNEAKEMYHNTTYFLPERALEAGFIGSILRPDPPA